MKGVVLCGGQSLRMGKDKGLMIGSRKITWAQHSVSLFTPLELEVVISVNQNQSSAYRRVFYSNTLIKDNDEILVEGPLLGILSVHKEEPAEDLMVLATDIINMEVEVLRHLMTTYNKEKNFEAIVFQNGNVLEPLCAIYTAKGLKNVLAKYQKSEHKNYSMKHALDQLKVLRLPLKPEWKHYFANINTPADLQGN
jgi:molybdenum cofactor guanylyltransferase